MFTLTDRIALVTGGSRGLGRVIVSHLAAAGALVVFCYRKEREAIRELSEEIEQRGYLRPLPFQADITHAEERKALVDYTVEQQQRIDILVNNAGTTMDAVAFRMKEQWDQLLELNLTAPFRLTQLVIRHMMKNGYGRVINIGSIAGRLGSPAQVNYGASKAGLEGMTRGFAQEYGRKGITVNTVSPGFLETELTADGSSYARAYLEAYSATGVPPSLESVADAVTFFASEESWAITGQTLNVDGGLVKL